MMNIISRIMSELFGREPRQRTNVEFDILPDGRWQYAGGAGELLDDALTGRGPMSDAELNWFFNNWDQKRSVSA